MLGLWLSLPYISICFNTADASRVLDGHRSERENAGSVAASLLQGQENSLVSDVEAITKKFKPKGGKGRKFNKPKGGKFNGNKGKFNGNKNKGKKGGGKQKGGSARRPPPKPSTNMGGRASARRISGRFSQRGSARKSAMKPGSVRKGSAKGGGGLHRLTRFLNEFEEASFREKQAISAKVNNLTERPSGEVRLATPFEHVCGGNAMSVNKGDGNDGPTQFISFSNAGGYPKVASDCKSPFDKGQRRIFADGADVKRQNGFTFDFSSDRGAWKWCYEGGCIKSKSGQQMCFKGAKTIAPWPYACAIRAYGLHAGAVLTKSPGDGWWTPENRKLIAQSCQIWATRVKEVLVLPNPDDAVSGMFINYVAVKNDRKPAQELCTAGPHDRCVDFNFNAQSVECAGADAADHSEGFFSWLR